MSMKTTKRLIIKYPRFLATCKRIIPRPLFSGLWKMWWVDFCWDMTTTLCIFRRPSQNISIINHSSKKPVHEWKPGGGYALTEQEAKSQVSVEVVETIISLAIVAFLIFRGELEEILRKESRWFLFLSHHHLPFLFAAAIFVFLAFFFSFRALFLAANFELWEMLHPMTQERLPTR